jgi:hypothetical protein
LDEVGIVPAQEEIEELVEAKLSEEITEQQLSNIAAEFEPTVEWKSNATGDENCMGYWEYLPIDMYDEEMHR